MLYLKELDKSEAGNDPITVSEAFLAINWLKAPDIVTIKSSHYRTRLQSILAVYASLWRQRFWGKRRCVVFKPRAGYLPKLTFGLVRIFPRI